MAKTVLWTWALVLIFTWLCQVEAMRARTRNHVNSICSAWGKDHFKTFDGDIYQFPGMCEYNLVSDCHEAYLDFSVHMKRAEVNGHPTVSRIVITIKDLIILLTENLVTVNGEIVTTPYHGSGVLLEKNTIYTKLYAKLGLSVMWNGEDAVTLELDSKYQNRTCGLCGDFNGIPLHFEFLEGGRQISSIEFGNRQKVHLPTEYCEDPSEEEEEFEDSGLDKCSKFHNSCAELLQSEGWRSCAQVLSPEPYIQACMQDMCSCGDLPDDFCICSTLTEYSRQCSHAGGAPPNWRSPNLCEKKCPLNMVYSESGSPCMDTCSHTDTSLLCEEHLMDGCVCPEGTVFDDISERGCISQEQCQCVHDKVYNSGEVLLQDCEECVCNEGRWSCKSLPCPGQCAVEGGSHVTTYDGKAYTFHGGCYYILTKDCVGSKFSVLGQLVPCGSQELDTCLKSVVLLLNNDKNNALVIKADGKVSHNAEISLPYSTANVHMFRPSSFHIMLQTDFGLELQIQLIPIMQLYITLDQTYLTKTCGLCGNFNMVLHDDLKTPQGLVEGTAASFANSWKAQASCPNRMERLDDPCSLSVENENYAEYWCSLLQNRKSEFSKCHTMVNPEAYYKRCKYSSCNCEKSEDCLCAVFSSYVRACQDKGVELQDWRTNVCGRYTETCPASQTFSYQLQQCQRTCRSLGSDRPSCSTDFLPVDGCSCPDGLYQDERGVCVTMAKCPCYHNGDHVKPGKSITIKEEHCVCSNGRLHCRSWKARSEICPPPKVFFSCTSAGPNEQGIECARTCTNLNGDCFSSECESGCQCPSGLVDDGRGNCVKEHDCPCLHDGNFYAPGRQIPDQCNTCTCTRGMWNCTDQKCPGTCTIYGSGHHMTFDEKRFGFRGQCGYVAVQDKCGNKTGMGNFRVITENIPCGSTGTTCSKSVRIYLGSTELKLSGGQVEEVSHKDYTDYTVRIVGLYIVIDSRIGISVVWDRKTSVRIILEPDLMGKVCGLCGDFDGDAKDDFTTQGQLVVSSALEFANSWKVSSSCPDAGVDTDPCSSNPHRHSWAMLQCSIIKGNTFKNCHDKVNPLPYYENCVSDSCACDTGGDCECFCTAVAAYAQACNEAEVCVAWRTPDLCPVYCDYFNAPLECKWHYSPCHTPCYKTCFNPQGICNNPQPNMEGCYPSCPPEKPIFDEGKQICVEVCDGCYINETEYEPGQKVPTEELCTSCVCAGYGNVTCEQKTGCCVYNGTQYDDGDIIYDVTDNMGMCYYAICKNGTVIHGHETCTTTVEPSTPTPSTTTATTTTTEPPSTTPPPTTTTKPTTPSTTPVTTTTTKPPTTTPPPTTTTTPSTPSTTTVEPSTPTPSTTTATTTTKPPTTTPPPTMTTTPSTPSTTTLEPSTPTPTTTPATTTTQPPTTTTPPITTTTTESSSTPPTTTTKPPTPSTTPVTTTTTKPPTTTPPPTTTTTPPTPSTTTVEPSTPTPSTTTATTTTQPPSTTPPPTTTTTPPTPSTTTVEPSTPTECIETCEWSEWFDVDKPSSIKGDWETYENITASGKEVCEIPEDIQCRAEAVPDLSLEEFVNITKQVVHCNSSFGLICKNEEQVERPYKCVNYGIRVFCCVPCPSTTTPTATPATTTTEPPSTTPPPTTTTKPPTPSTTTTPVTTTTTEPPTTTPPPTTTTPTTTPATTTTEPPSTTPPPTTTTKPTTPSTTPVTTTTTKPPTTTPPPTTTTTPSTPSTTTLEPSTPTPTTTPATTTTQPPTTTTPTITTTTTEPPSTPPTATTKPPTPSTTPVTTTTTKSPTTTPPPTTTTTPPTPSTTTVEPSTPTPSTTTATTTTKPPTTTPPPTTTTTPSTPSTTTLEPSTPTPTTTPATTTTQPPTTTTPPITTTTTESSSTPPTTTTKPPTPSTTPVTTTTTKPPTTTPPPTTTTTPPTPSTTTVEPSTPTPSTTTATTTTQPPSTTPPPTTTTTPPTPSTTTVEPSTPTECIETCEWSEWFDVDKPSSIKGDWETYENITASGKEVCEIPEDIQCRAEAVPDLSLEEFVNITKQVVHCNSSFGLICKNEEQVERPYKCVNYGIRVFCCVPCPSTTTPTATPATTTTEPPSTPPTTTTKPPTPSTTTTPVTTTTTEPPTTTPPPTTTTPTTTPATTTTESPSTPPTTTTKPPTPSTTPVTTTTTKPPTTTPPPTTTTTPPTPSTTPVTTTTKPPTTTTEPPSTPPTTTTKPPTPTTTTVEPSTPTPSTTPVTTTTQPPTTTTQHPSTPPTTTTKPPTPTTTTVEPSTPTPSTTPVTTTTQPPTTTTQHPSTPPTTTTKPPTPTTTTLEPSTPTPSTTLVTTTTQPPTTTTQPPSTPPTTTTKPPTPSTTTVEPSTPTPTTTPATTTTQPPTTTTEPPPTPPTTTTKPPTPSTTTVEPSTPTPTTTPATTTTQPPTTTTEPPLTPPTTTTKPPTPSTTPVTTTTEPPTTTTPVITTTTTEPPPTPPTTTTKPPTPSTTTVEPSTPTPTTTPATTTTQPPTTTTEPPLTPPTTTTKPPTPSTTPVTTTTEPPTTTTPVITTTTTEPPSTPPTTTTKPPTPSTTTVEPSTPTTTPATTTEPPTTTTEPPSTPPTTTTKPPTTTTSLTTTTRTLPTSITTPSTTYSTEPPVVTGGTVTPFSPLTGSQVSLPTTPCFCIVNGTQYQPGATIYNMTHIGSGICLTIICSSICEIHNTTEPCPTSPIPPTPKPPGCPEWDVVQNETFLLCNCTMAICIENNTIEIIPFKCPPLEIITCTNRKKPVLEWDEHGCCQHYVCDCYCEGWGDPHYITFDGLFYSFQGNCTYVLMEEITAWHKLKIYIDNVHCDPAEVVSCPRSIIVSYKTDVITLKNHNLIGAANLEAIINGAALPLPYPGKNIKVLHTGINLVLEIPVLEVVVTFGVTGFSIDLPFRHFGNNTQGQCGTCNNNQADDCMLPNGQLVKDCAVMGDYWPAEDLYRPDCSVPPFLPTSPPVPIPTDKPCGPNSVCDLLKSSLFAECHAVVSPEPFFRGCVFDSCHMINPTVECTSLQTYAAACLQSGICLHWRNQTEKCPSDCPADRVYKPCGPAEQPTCADTANDPSMQFLTEGCFCPDGMKLFNKESGVCVEKCGCLDPSGEPREFNEVFQYKCQDCICDQSTKTVICEPMHCPAPEVVSCNKTGFIIVNETNPTKPCCFQLVCRCDGRTCPGIAPDCKVGFNPVISVPDGDCCPQYTCKPKRVCVHDNKEYMPGASVPVIACQDCICTTVVDPTEGLLSLRCTLQPCNEACKPGFRYIETEDECCGRCVQSHCVVQVDGHIQLLEHGHTWSPPGNKCEVHSCLRINGAFISTLSNIQCPTFNDSNCQPGTIQVTADGCCNVCVEKDRACKIETTKTHIVHESCQSVDEIRMAYCEGACNTYTKYYGAPVFTQHSCTCCQESRTSNRTVNLLCQNGDLVPYTYIHVEACSCRVTDCYSVNEAAVPLPFKRHSQSLP